MRFGHSPVDGHTSRSLGTFPGFVPVVSASSEMRCTQSLDGWRGGEETGAVAAGEFPKVPQRVLFFLGKILLLILWLPLYKEGPVLSHSPPLQLGGGLSRSGSHRAQLSNFQLSSASPRGLPGFSISSLFPSLRLQATRSLTVLLRPCLAGEGAVNPALSQESCSRHDRAGSGAVATLVPGLVPGLFCPEAIPLPSVFSVSSVLFGLLSS